MSTAESLMCAHIATMYLNAVVATVQNLTRMFNFEPHRASQIKAVEGSTVMLQSDSMQAGTGHNSVQPGNSLPDVGSKAEHVKR